MKLFSIALVALALAASRPCLVSAKGKPTGGGGGGGGGDGETETKCAAAGQVSLACDPGAKGKKPASCCAGLQCRNVYCNYADATYEAGAAECGGPAYPTHCAPGLVCDPAPGSARCVEPVCDDATCELWCHGNEVLGWYHGGTNPLDSYTATDTTIGCSSSTGCPCTLSAVIANTWTIVTGGICDSHNFNPNCDGPCDGTQCDDMFATIGGRVENGACICTATVGDITKDVWSSKCAENTDYHYVPRGCEAWL